MRDWFDAENLVVRDIPREKSSAGQLVAPSPMERVPSPLEQVSVRALRFNLTDDLRVETQLRIWELTEQQGFAGVVQVTYSSDAFSDWQDVYSAAVDIAGQPTAFGLGADPYQALARAISCYL